MTCLFAQEESPPQVNMAALNLCVVLEGWESSFLCSRHGRAKQHKATDCAVLDLVLEHSSLCEPQNCYSEKCFKCMMSCFPILITFKIHRKFDHYARFISLFIVISSKA